jgi:hypothetical protein
MKRQKIHKSYVKRRKNGQFKEFVSIKRSLAADRRKDAQNIVKPGYGDRGDQKKKTKHKFFGLF